MNIPQDIWESIQAARQMPAGTWPQRWRYPDTDAARAYAVWNALARARNYLESTYRCSFPPRAGETSRDTIDRLSHIISDNFAQAEAAELRGL